MREKFTAEEWEQLKLFPFLLFTFVNGYVLRALRSEGWEVDPRQAAALVIANDLDWPHRSEGGEPHIRDPLHREVAADTPEGQWRELYRVGVDPLDPSRWLGAADYGDDARLACSQSISATASFVRSNLILEQYEGYLTSVVLNSGFLPIVGMTLHPDGRRAATEGVNELAKGFEVELTPATLTAAGEQMQRIAATLMDELAGPEDGAPGVFARLWGDDGARPQKVMIQIQGPPGLDQAAVQQQVSAALGPASQRFPQISDIDNYVDPGGRMFIVLETSEMTDGEAAQLHALATMGMEQIGPRIPLAVASEEG